LQTNRETISYLLSANSQAFSSFGDVKRK